MALLLCVGIIGFLPTQGAFSQMANRSEEAVVIAYGHRLERPFLFTGEGGDTLYLNGFPYCPLRKAPEALPESIATLVTSSSREDSTRWVLGRDAAQAAASSVGSLEGVQNALNIYKASDLVEHAFVGGGILFVKYKAFPDTIEVYLPAPGTDLKELEYGKVPRSDPAEIHRRLISTFWALVRGGALIEFGETYRYSSPRHTMERAPHANE